jgi:hypothetical protein
MIDGGLHLIGGEAKSRSQGMLNFLPNSRLDGFKPVESWVDSLYTRRKMGRLHPWLSSRTAP